MCSLTSPPETEIASSMATLSFVRNVVVADLHDIIASKEWANRPKDQEALPELRDLMAQMELDDAPRKSKEPLIRPEREGPGLGLW
jgi:hypothetical protein